MIKPKLVSARFGFGFSEEIMSLKITENITSRKNRTIVETAKLHDRKYRSERGEFFIEGIKLFCEAEGAGADVKAVFLTEKAAARYKDVIERSHCERIYTVTDEVYEKLCTESAPQGVFAVIDAASVNAETRYTGLSVVLDGIADPGNLGTIIRCADALGAECVYIGENGADALGPKTVRAAMGSIFRVRTERCACADAVEKLKSDGYKVLAATLGDGSKDIRCVDLSGKVAFVIGNEGHGVSPEVAAKCDGSVIIPMTGGAESLNASVASAILMWEKARLG